LFPGCFACRGTHSNTREPAASDFVLAFLFVRKRTGGRTYNSYCPKITANPCVGQTGNPQLPRHHFLVSRHLPQAARQKAGAIALCEPANFPSLKTNWSSRKSSAAEAKSVSSVAGGGAYSTYTTRDHRSTTNSEKSIVHVDHATAIQRRL